LEQVDSPRETPGTTTRLIVDHVRRRAGDAGVTLLLSRSLVAHDLVSLVDDSAWFTYDEKIALFEAAAEILDDPDVGKHVGESVFDGDGGGLLQVLRALGSPGAVLAALIEASGSFCPVADMTTTGLADHDGVVRYRLHDEHKPSRHDCQYTIGLLTQISTIFGLPPADVEHPACQVDGSEACVYHVRWSAAQRPRRFLGRRPRRELVRGLAARFWELEGATLDLVSDGDPSTVLAAIASRAADAIGATGHVLVLTDADGSMPSVIRHGLVGGSAALVDGALGGLVDDDDPTRIVAPLASDRRDYGFLIAVFDDGHEVIPEARTILRTYARHAATAIDAASAITSARVREETASLLLRLARSLADLTTVDDVIARVAELVPTVTGADQAAVLLWDAPTRSLVVRATAGVPLHLVEEVSELSIPIETAGDGLPSSVGWEPTIIPRASAQGFVADLMDRHGETSIALVPLRLRGHLRGMITLGWRRSSDVGVRDVVLERLAAVGDHAATALENATLLEQVRHQALHDALTGLPNQTLFADRVTTELTRARRNRSRVAVGVLDLDRFKTVNDSLGHNAGDQLLVQVTERLAHAVRGPDTLARMGGDEFTLLLPDIKDGAEGAVVERILESFVQPFEVEGHRLRISPSIGIAVFPDDGDGVDQLLRCADVAMYRAKDHGRNTWACYASGMAERAYDRLTLESDLYRALQRRELRVAYQPIVRVADGQACGTEALVRWAHPTLGLLTPEEFLPIAEDLGLMAEIDGWVLRHACIQLGSALANRTRIEHVAVNLSARTLCHPALERLVADALSAGGVDPARLVIEISESVTADRTIAISEPLQALRERGVRVALDDFGRGSSALSRLEQLPIDQLKVDKMFLAGIDDEHAPAPVAEAIVAMGHGLGVAVVAEGVETEAQRAFAARVGFDFAQGWLLGRPGTELDYTGARSRTA
jgi:diguanylate cyclase (GGDEF)-like protein